MKKFLLVMVLCLISVVSSFGQVSFSSNNYGSTFRTTPMVLVGSGDNGYLTFAMQNITGKGYSQTYAKFTYFYHANGNFPIFVGVNITLTGGAVIRLRDSEYLGNKLEHRSIVIDDNGLLIQVGMKTSDYTRMSKGISKIHAVCLNSKGQEYRVDMTGPGVTNLQNQCKAMVKSFK